MYPKQFYVRIVFNDGRTKTEEFSHELLAKSSYNAYVAMQYELGIKSIHIGKLGQMPEDCAQAFMAHIKAKRALVVAGGVR